jgi:predicted NACHT family NTPase
VLLGDPGAGKSTLARFLVLTLAGGSAATALPGLDGRLPLLVELRVFADLRGECPTFLDFLHRMHEREGLGLPRDLLEWYLAEDGRALVVFDGLDELFDPKVREAVAREIGGFAAHFPRVRVVVTSRVIGYRRPVLDNEGFAHFTVQDLDTDQIGTFVQRWYGVALRDRPAEAAARRDRLMRAVADSPSIRELAGNPLLLTILAIIGRRRELPRERRKVYEHAATVLVEQWDPTRHLHDASVRVDYVTPDDRRQMLRRVAARMQAGRSGLAGNHIRGEELVEELAGYLTGRYQLEPVAAATGARAMLAQFRERNFILSRYGAEVYGFVHRAFLEYFCADQIVRRFQHTRELSPEKLTREVFGAHWADDAWREVLLLVVGTIDERFAGPIVDYLVRDVNPLWASTPHAKSARRRRDPAPPRRKPLLDSRNKRQRGGGGLAAALTPRRCSNAPTPGA